MSDAAHQFGWRWISLAFAGALALLAGCGPRNYKQDADEQVYDFVDRQWKPQFGPRANYRVEGASPAPNDIDVERVARIEKVVSATRLLTIPQAATIATVHNREYHLQKELLYTLALDMRLVRHAYETQWFSGGTALYSRINEDERVVVEPDLGFNRLLGTGALVSARVGLRWVDTLLGFGDSGLSSVFGASVTQPLLRGSDPRVVLEPLTQAQRSALYQIRTVSRFRKILLVAVVTQYYEALELQDVTRNAAAYVHALVVLETRVAQLVDAGRLPKEELDQVRQQILRAQDAWILARSEYERFLDTYKITLGVPPTMEFHVDARVLAALRAKGIPFPDLTPEEAVQTALCQRLDLTNNADAVLDAQRAVYVATDALRAGLNVFGSADVATNGDKAITGGVALDLPLDRVAEQNVYAKALVLLNQRQREYDLTADTIRMEVREAHRKLCETAQRYQVLSAGLRLAQERVENTFELLRNVRLSSRRVLDALSDLYDAQNEAADALTDYAIATLDFYRDTEALQVRPDGLWETGSLELPTPETDSLEKNPVARR